MDQKTIQLHREMLSIFTLKALVFCSNIKIIVLLLIKTRKTRFTRHSLNLVCLNFKMIEKFFAFKCNSDH